MSFCFNFTIPSSGELISGPVSEKGLAAEAPLRLPPAQQRRLETTVHSVASPCEPCELPRKNSLTPRTNVFTLRINKPDEKPSSSTGSRQKPNPITNLI